MVEGFRKGKYFSHLRWRWRLRWRGGIRTIKHGSGGGRGSFWKGCGNGGISWVDGVVGLGVEIWVMVFEFLIIIIIIIIIIQVE